MRSTAASMPLGPLLPHAALEAARGDLSFAPQLATQGSALAPQGVPATLGLSDDPEGYLARVAERERVRERERERARHAGMVRAVSECTFTPAIRPCPQ